MQCEHTRPWGKGTSRCKNNARAGFNLCYQHGWSTKYFIQFSWQERAGDHWTMKSKAIWPILFPTKKLAQEHLNTVPHPFQNMLPRRKLTCCVERTKRTFPVALLRRV